MECPLCSEKNDIFVLEKFDSKLLVDLYKKHLNIHLKYPKRQFNKYKCNHCKLIFFDNDFEVDNNFYKILSSYNWYYQNEKNEYFIISNYLDSKSKVLDIGSGTGNFYKINNSDFYLGLEPSLEKEIILGNNAKIVPKKIEEVSIEFFEYFDAVVCFQVLEHIKNPKSFINESLKVLKKDGLFIISVPNNDSFLKYSKNPILNFPPHHFIRWNQESLLFLKNIFKLKNPIIINCPLDEIHYDNFSYALSIKIIEEALKMQTRELSNNYFLKFFNKISIPLRKHIKNLLIKNILQPFGHSIIAIYKKI